MIAFVLAELGLDPAWLVGGEIAQLGGNAGAGEAGWSPRVTSPTGPIERLRPQIAVVTNVELDHHSTFASAAEVEELFDALACGGPACRARLGARAGVVRAPSSPGEHNRQERRSCARGARARRRRPRRAPSRVLARFRGATGASSSSASAAASRSSTTTLTTRRRSQRPSRRRASERTAACSFCSSRISTRGRVTSAHELGAALSTADAVCVTEIYRAPRGAHRRASAGSSSSTRCAPGLRTGWAPSVEDGVRILASWARAGDLVLTVGAGDVDRAGPLRRSRPWREDRREHRAGAADDDRHRRPRARLREADDPRRARAGARRGPTQRHLRGRHRRPRFEPSRRRRGRGGARPSTRRATWRRSASTDQLLIAGGGATNAVCLHQARAAGLGGFEFACAIPGTAGGGVWMNAGAYGSDWSQILVRAHVVTAAGAGWLTPAELGLSYRHSSSGTDRSSPRSSTASRLVRRRRSSRRSATLIAQRKATQPTNKRTFGSVFKNPEHELGAGRHARGVRAQGASRSAVP